MPLKTSAWRAQRTPRTWPPPTRALPAIPPAPVLPHAPTRPFTPPMPRLAIDGYWRAHPIRADRLARALAAKSGEPAGWAWRLASGRRADLPKTFRFPPAPYRERAFARGPRYLCGCCPPGYRLRWACRLLGAGGERPARSDR